MPSHSSYNYTFNNPIRYNDPDGKKTDGGPIFGAILGAVVEVTAQVGVAYYNGATIGEAFSNIDIVDVGLAAGEGALTSGASVLKTIAITAGSEVIKAGVDVKMDGSRDIIGTKGSKKTGTGLLKDASLGTLGGAAGAGSEGFLKAATNLDLEKQLPRAAEHARRGMTGSASKAASEAKVNAIETTIKGNNVVSEAAGEVIDKTITNQGNGT